MTGTPRDYMESAAIAACDTSTDSEDWKFAAVEYFQTARSLGLTPQTLRPIPRMPFGKYRDEALLDVAKKDPDYLRGLLARSKSLSEPFRAEIRFALDEAPNTPPNHCQTFRRKFHTGAEITVRIGPQGHSISWENAPATFSEIQQIHPHVVAFFHDLAREYHERTDLALHSFWVAFPPVKSSEEQLSTR